MKYFLSFLLCLFLIIFGALFYFGAFTTINVETKKLPKLTFIYEKYTGPYKNVGSVMEKLSADLKNSQIEPKEGVGIYLDNPATSKPEEMRSMVGWVVENIDETKIAKFKFATLPELNSIYSTFPYKGMISYFIAPMKVWPAMQAKIDEMKINTPTAGIEIYKPEKGIIEFYMPIEENVSSLLNLWNK